MPKLFKRRINENKSSAFSIFFSDSKLTKCKALLAEAFKNNLEALTIKDRESILKFNDVLQQLNFAIEELSQDKNPNYMNIKLTNKDEIKQLFTQLIATWPAITKLISEQINQDNKAILQVISEKIIEFQSRNDDQGLGKKYSPAFSSGLNRVVMNIDKIIQEDLALEMKLATPDSFFKFLKK